MKAKNAQVECSFCKWYPMFTKNALEAVIIPIPKEICKYLEHDAFLLPIEAASNNTPVSTEWSDGSVVNDEPDEDSEQQPSFPDFSRRIKEVIDQFDTVFVKCNWHSPSDATWVTSTKTLKCNSLDDIYCLLKSSDRVMQDLKTAKDSNLEPCLVLKKWREIDPCTEFRCFVVNRELVGICQRDVSQYYKHIEDEKYDIQRDIKSLYMEKVKDQFTLESYSFDVIRYKKDRVKIVDFKPLDTIVTKGSLFTLEELQTGITEAPEFRCIAEDMGIQPTTTGHFCIPQEITEFFQAAGDISMMDQIRKEIEEQRREESTDSDQG